MNEHIGMVAPGSGQKEIIIYSKQNLKTDYAAVNAEGKRFVFEIYAVETINEKLRDTEYYRLMAENDDFSRYTIFKYTALLIGVLSGDNIAVDMHYIVPPGTKIYPATDDDIKNIYDIETGEKRMKIGRLFKNNSLSVNIDFEGLFATHASILGRTGSGKTYFIKCLLNKINTKFIVISSTDEYDFLANNHSNDSDLFSAQLPFSQIKRSLNINDSEMFYLNDFVEKTKPSNFIMSPVLSEMIYSFYSSFNAQKDYQHSLFGENASKKNVEIPRYVATLCEKLSLVDIGIVFQKSLLEYQYPLIFNTQGMTSKTEDVAVFSLLSVLLHERIAKLKSEEKKPDDILIILEEAHNYAPSVRKTICKDIIIQIARVGRKYGLHLLVLSQRPRYIDQTLLSQCGTNIIFNLPNPDDVEYIMEHSSYYNEKSRALIQNLNTGVCLIASNARKSDIICEISFD
jgi:hypothetical protein